MSSRGLEFSREVLRRALLARALITSANGCMPRRSDIITLLGEYFGPSFGLKTWDTRWGKTVATPAGTEAYNVDAPSVTARGASYTDADLDAALAGPVSEILWDDAGKADLGRILAALATTEFAAEGVTRALSAQAVPPNWRVGEALAEAFLVEHRGCDFPWPSGRDLKNPDASPAGTDLVGFHRTGQVANGYRFAFGEVKTSGQESWPPSVMEGRHGLAKQLEDLRDSTQVKDALLLYLGHHAQGKGWFPQYQSAATRYLSDPSDVSLFGVLVRDVVPKPEDLSGRAGGLAKGCPAATAIELRAVYLPRQSIDSLAKRATQARAAARTKEGDHVNN